MLVYHRSLVDSAKLLIILNFLDFDSDFEVKKKSKIGCLESVTVGQTTMYGIRCIESGHKYPIFFSKRREPTKGEKKKGDREEGRFFFYFFLLKTLLQRPNVKY